MDKVKSYLKQLCNGFNLLVSLLIISVAMTLLIANYDFNLLGLIAHGKKSLLFVIFLAVIFGLLTIGYMVLNLKNEKTTVSDCLAFALMVLGVIYFIYTACALKFFNVRRVLAIVLMLVFGLGYIFTRVLFIATNKKEAKVYPNNSVRGYYLKILKMLPLPAFILISVVMVCISYMVMVDGFARFYINGSKLTLVFSTMLGLPFVVYCLKSLFSKVVSLFDALLVPVALTLLVVFIQLFVKDFSVVKMTVWAVVVAIYLVVIFIRFRLFDLSATEDKAIVETKDYSKAVLGKYSIVEILAVGGLLALTSLVLLKTRVVAQIVALKQVTPGTLPLIVVFASVVLAVAYLSFASLVNCLRKKVCIADFFNAIIIAFIIFGILSLTVYTSKLYAYLLFALALYQGAMLIVRIIKTKK